MQRSASNLFLALAMVTATLYPNLHTNIKAQPMHHQPMRTNKMRQTVYETNFLNLKIFASKLLLVARFQ